MSEPTTVRPTPTSDPAPAPPHASGRPGGNGHGGPAAGSAPVAYPPLTLEGWYAHHQLLTVDRERLRRLPAAERARAADALAAVLEELRAPAEGGWTAPALLVGRRRTRWWSTSGRRSTC
jgi:hypothetical protein